MYSISVAKKVETTPEEKSTQYEGLCATCIHVSTCAYNRNWKEPRCYCEEFEANPTSSTDVILGTTVSVFAERYRNTARREDPVNYEGLCVNCTHRESCTFPKPEGGIWHCEEYC